MRFVRSRLAYVAAATLLPLAACLSPPVESPKTTVIQETHVRVDQSIKNKVDVLFMIDNSSSMDPMQLELRSKFGQFFQVFEDLATQGTYADLQIGVITSDYGAGDVAGGGCDASPGGDKGVLQTLPSPKATNPPAGCMPPRAHEFIQFRFNPDGTTTTNLPNGNDAAALVDEFTCMASVGASGCGFEHQLESAYAALHDVQDNPDFLRPDAFLAVVFVTNEDDGSAAPNAKFYEPASDPNGTSTYGQYSTYRQTRFAVQCGGMDIPYGMPVGPLAGCAAAANPSPMVDVNHAYDLSRYIDFFTLPQAQGGVKPDPDDVILVAIDGPETPFSTVLYDPAGGNAPYQACPPGSPLSANCVEALQHSCENDVQKGFFADPAVRLNAVVRSAAHSNIASICGDDVTKAPDFTNAMQELGNLIKSVIQPGCVNSPIENRPDGTPDCIVEDVTLDGDGTTTTREIPYCGSNGGAPPCWQVNDLLAQYDTQGCAMMPPAKACSLPDKCQPVTNPVTGMRQLASISIVRGNTTVPPMTTAHVACATVASSM